MEKRVLIILLTLTAVLCGCGVVGKVLFIGFKMGIYSVLIVLGLIVWIIYKRDKRRKLNDKNRNYR
jgi:preprotein translocase subunit SecF